MLNRARLSNGNRRHWRWILSQRNHMKPHSKPSTRGPLSAGRPWPLGVEWVQEDDAFNFALYSQHATGVTLMCYSQKDPVKPVFQFRFRHPAHKTGSIWHCRIPASELRRAALYAYRVEGPHDAGPGRRFDPQKILLDPYAPSVFFPPDFSRDACARSGPTDGRAPLGRLPKRGGVSADGQRSALLRPRRHRHELLTSRGFTARATWRFRCETRTSPA